MQLTDGHALLLSDKSTLNDAWSKMKKLIPNPHLSFSHICGFWKCHGLGQSTILSDLALTPRSKEWKNIVELDELDAVTEVYQKLVLCFIDPLSYMDREKMAFVERYSPLIKFIRENMQLLKMPAIPRVRDVLHWLQLQWPSEGFHRMGQRGIFLIFLERYPAYEKFTMRSAANWSRLWAANELSVHLSESPMARELQLNASEIMKMFPTHREFDMWQFTNNPVFFSSEFNKHVLQRLSEHYKLPPNYISDTCEKMKTLFCPRYMSANIENAVNKRNHQWVALLTILQKQQNRKRKIPAIVIEKRREVKHQKN